MTSFYKVGPHYWGDDGCDGYEWVVYWYKSEPYEGNGEAVSFDGKDYRVHCLSHDSCFGPEAGMERGDVVALQDLLGEAICHGVELLPEVLSKVRELVVKL